MLKEIFTFELKFQLRQPTFLIACGLFFLMVFLAVSSSFITISGSIGKVNRNAPYVIMQLQLVMSLLAIFFTTAFVAGTVLRDRQSRTDEIFFSLPIGKRDYLLGRFGGSLVASLGVSVAAALGIFVASLMPWLDPERVRPFRPFDYLFSIVFLAAPTLLFTACVFFSIATLTRSTIATYAGVIGLIVSYIVAGTFLADVENKTIAILLDPFGSSTFQIASKYWTVSDKNVQLLALDGPFLANRALWLGLSLAFLAFTVWKFRFEAVGARKRNWKMPWKKSASQTPENAETRETPTTGRRPIIRPQRVYGWATSLRQLRHQSRMEVRLVLRSVAFPIIVFFGVLNIVGNSFSIDQLFGTPVYPVTHLMVQILASASLFMFVIVTFYAGELVWRDCSLDTSDVVDSLPAPNWIFWGAKLTAFLMIVVALLLMSMLTGILIQFFRGYTNFELGLYLRGIFLVTGMPFLLGTVLSIFFQVATNNRYLGFLAMILFIVGVPTLSSFDFNHNLYKIMTIPGAPYSDMNGYGHFVKPLFWYTLYWTIFAGLLAIAIHLFRVRGRVDRWRDRFRVARQRFDTGARVATAATLVAFLATGSWIFYNTNILNEYVPPDVARERQVQREKDYKQYEDLPQPKIRRVYADVDIFPERRGVEIRGRYTLENATGEPLETLHVSLNSIVDIESMEIEGATIASADDDAGYYIYDFVERMAPGEIREMNFEISISSPGFVNHGAFNQLARNGTFFTSSQVFPSIGYSRFAELGDPNRRRKAGLAPIQRTPDLDDLEGRKRNFFSAQADWIDFETVVSTSPEQIAVAPGYLQKEWEEDGRRYFHYKMDSPILAFWSYQSADWEVARDQWNDVKIEIYYDRQHPYNVERMIYGVKKSLEYFSENFSPYQHKQARILEFPRYSRFAQSLPNTIPFSESIGFIARLDEDEKDAIDYVFYVTAHEVAHQWWAHQVVGGFVQGATVMSETMSQYSALMVMEKEYGREKMRRFLKYELDNYLSSRGGELIEELPLMRVEGQGYIHYRKGSLVTYALRDYLGEDVLNGALKRYVAATAFQQPPYTYSREFVEFIAEVVPEGQEHLIEDLFETITLYDNKTEAAVARPLDDGRYSVQVNVVAHKFRADGQGLETEIPIDDWIDVAVFGEEEAGGPSTGKLLKMEKHRITQSEQSFELIVDTKPVRAGVDPFHKLIDRIPDDNVKRVSEAKASAAAGSS